MNYHHQITTWIRDDTLRMEALLAVKFLGLPDCWIAAGFVRNLVWSHLFEKETATNDVNDIDVIYYCPADCSPSRDKRLEQQLHQIAPGLPWSVKNQARMHIRNGDRPYRNALDAMAHWPEKQTAIGVRLEGDGSLVLGSPFDLTLLFNGTIEHNPARAIAVFQQRLATKGWLESWPELRVVDETAQ